MRRSTSMKEGAKGGLICGKKSLGMPRPRQPPKASPQSLQRSCACSRRTSCPYRAIRILSCSVPRGTKTGVAPGLDMGFGTLGMWHARSLTRSVATRGTDESVPGCHLSRIHPRPLGLEVTVFPGFLACCLPQSPSLTSQLRSLEWN